MLNGPGRYTHHAGGTVVVRGFSAAREYHKSSSEKEESKTGSHKRHDSEVASEDSEAPSRGDQEGGKLTKPETKPGEDDGPATPKNDLNMYTKLANYLQLKLHPGSGTEDMPEGGKERAGRSITEEAMAAESERGRAGERDGEADELVLIVHGIVSLRGWCAHVISILLIEHWFFCRQGQKVGHVWCFAVHYVL
jgi:hypothetical protein